MFNLSFFKKVKAQNIDSRLKDNRKSLGLEKSDVPTKNVNFSLPVKDDKPNVVIEKNMDKMDRKEVPKSIIESNSDDKQVNFEDNSDAVSAINALAQKLYQEKADEISKKESNSEKDLSFFSKYVGEEKIQPLNKIDDNVPESGNLLENTSEAFENKKILGELKTADAMLFSIMASAYLEGRELNKNENQQIIDIKSSKLRKLAQLNNLSLNDVSDVNSFDEHTNNKQNPVIEEIDGSYFLFEKDGRFIDGPFESVQEIKVNYPEAQESM